MKKVRFMLNSGVAVLCLFALALVLGAWGYLACISPELRTNVGFSAIMGILVLSIILCLGFSYELLGWVLVAPEAIKLYAPFRLPLTICYKDVQYIGIGKSYGDTRDRRNERFVYTSSHDFWIYLSMDPVPLEQLNDMRKFKLTRRGMRIAYSKKVYDTLRELLPAHLSKELQRHQTTLRAHKHSE